jgi:adsorption protein B
LIDWNGQPLAGRTAIFVPAWADEGYGFTISQMFGVGPQPDGREPDCRVYVGCASENAAALSRTIVATAGDPQVRLVIHGGPDPACKVDVVDRLFQALHADEARLNIRFQTVLLHDASDGRHRLGLVRLDCSPACPIFTLRGLPSRGVLGYPWHPRWMFTFL